MLGSFLTRGLVLAFGYAYPAYECYKTVERNKPEIEHLLFWCQYWILVATLTVCERVGDAFISWVPMYSEAKLAFFIYLWYPKTKGTSYVYDSFFRPYIAKHESDIDRNLLELRTRAGDMAVLYWQRAASYGQTRTLEILQFIASQSTPRPRPVQQQGPVTAALNRQPSKKAQIEEENKEPPSPTSSVSSSRQDQREVAAEVSEPSNAPTAASLSPAPSQAAAPKPSTSAEASSSIQSKTAEEAEAEAEAVHSEAATSGSNAEPPKETVMEGALRRTCGKLRKARSVTTRKEAESTGS